jgi:hypothetical protein
VRVWRLADAAPVVPPLDLAEGITAVAVHGNVIISAAGGDIAAHQPTLQGLCASCSSVSWKQRPAAERLDNGRLSGTSAGEPSTACS